MANRKKTQPKSESIEAEDFGVIYLTVTALDGYMNGMKEPEIAVWKRGETKKITPAQYKSLLNDNPSNWVVRYD